MALSNISASQSGGSARRFQREELGKLSCYGAKGWQAQLPWHQTKQPRLQWDKNGGKWKDVTRRFHSIFSKIDFHYLLILLTVLTMSSQNWWESKKINLGWVLQVHRLFVQTAGFFCSMWMGKNYPTKTWCCVGRERSSWKRLSPGIGGLWSCCNPTSWNCCFPIPSGQVLGGSPQ